MIHVSDLNKLLQQFYVAPLQGSLFKSAPNPISVKQCSLKAREKQSGVGHWHQAQCNWKTIPSRCRITNRVRGTSNCACSL